MIEGEWLRTGVILIGFLVSTVTGIIAVTWKFSTLVNDFKESITTMIKALEKESREKREMIRSEFETRITSFEAGQKIKVNRSYERLDEYKEHIEGKVLSDYVRKEVWESQYKNIEKMLDILSTESKATNEKIDAIKTLIMNIHK